VADLRVRLGPLSLDHPLINCSGTMEIFELAETFGPQFLQRPPVAAYVPKTVTIEMRAGNRPPRILETAAGMVNAIGLPGPGLEAFVDRELPRLLSLPCPLIISVGGFSGSEYATAARRLREALDRIAGAEWQSRVGLELNVSCPNVHSGCASIGADTGETHAAVGSVREIWPGLLVAKLTPNVTDLTAIGRAAEEAGADALSAVNTFKAVVIDRQTLRPYLGNTIGGLSGPAIKPLALRAIYELYQAVSAPIIGMGGVATTQDVLDFLACGARVVALGSTLFQDPCRSATLAASLAVELETRGVSLEDVIGCAHRSL